MFLFFLLVERILDGKETAFQRSPSEVILMLGQYNVQERRDFDNERYPGAWALVDSNVKLEKPHQRFTDSHSKFFLVQATSPQPQRWKGWKKELSAALAVMKLWTWEEIYIGG